MKYLLANLISGEMEQHQQRMVRELSRRFDTNWLNDYWTPAHFTLKHLFDEKYLDQVEALLEAWRFPPEPLEVNYKGYGFTDRVIWINTELSERAFQVYMDLIQQLQTVQGLEWDAHDGENRRFHLSISLFDIGDRLDDARKYLETQPCIFTGRFDNIALLEQGETGWIIRRYFAAHR